MDKVKELVNEQYEKMNLANRRMTWDEKQMLLSGKCQDIIYNEWGYGTQGLWDAVEKHVEELIPNEYDDEDE